MKYRTRIRYTETDKALMWERWRQGESLQRIAQLFDRNHSAIGGILSRSGGIRPSPRHRSLLALKLEEREEISRGVMAGGSTRTMARALGRAPSTVSREIGRNGGRQAYRASEADASAWQRARRPKRCKLAQNRALARLGDLFFGSCNSQIATLVERKTRYLMLAKVAGKDTETVVDALIKQAQKLPRELYKSLTWDRGSEMADHQRFSLATDVKVYFCDPQQPWQRGSNENTNGLLRQYFPKGIDLSDIPQSKLNAIARRLNERPRQTLDFETPAERFGQCVASIG
jgi:IS30 family transposase